MKELKHLSRSSKIRRAKSKNASGLRNINACVGKSNEDLGKSIACAGEYNANSEKVSRRLKSRNSKNTNIDSTVLNVCTHVNKFSRRISAESKKINLYSKESNAYSKMSNKNSKCSKQSMPSKNSKHSKFQNTNLNSTDLQKKKHEHIPVMLKEVTDCFANRVSDMRGVKILDCTFGRGGHSQSLLDLGASVVGLDRDENAIRYGQQNFERYIKSEQLKLFHSLWDADFIVNSVINDMLWTQKNSIDEGLNSELDEELNDDVSRGDLLERDKLDKEYKDNLVQDMEVLQSAPKDALQSKPQNAQQKFDGILIDMGVSSPQIDNSSYGFSYMKDSPLNMCMGLSDISAFDVVNNMSESEIEGIIRIYGEERYSKKIAAAIVKSRKSAKIETTFQLRDVMSSVIFDRFLIKSCARVFQAIRIFVNNELEQLAEFLKNVHKILKKDGVLCCIAYHSLEDRIVKRFFSFGPDAMDDNDLLSKSRYYSLNKLSDYDLKNYKNDKISRGVDSAIEAYKVYSATENHIVENTTEDNLTKKDNTEFYKHKRIFPSKEEIASNSRSRSAIMRYGVKK